MRGERLAIAKKNGNENIFYEDDSHSFLEFSHFSSYLFLFLLVGNKMNEYKNSFKSN